MPGQVWHGFKCYNIKTTLYQALYILNYQNIYSNVILKVQYDRLIKKI